VNLSPNGSCAETDDMLKKHRLLSASLTVALGSMPAAILAQESTVAPVPAAVPASMTANAFPSIFGASSAFPAAGNTGFIVLTYASPRGGVDGAGGDGDLAFGYTLGSPVNSVSVTAGVNVTGLEPLGDSGTLFISAARALSIGESGATFAGLSIGNLAGWGDARDSDESYSIYVSHLTSIPARVEIPVQFTFGYGNQTTLSTDGLGIIDDGFFAGMGLGVGENLSIGLSFTEATLNIGATVTMPGLGGLSFTAGVYDAADNANRQQFVLSVGYGF
jgi:hypothetical protein